MYGAGSHYLNVLKSMYEAKMNNIFAFHDTDYSLKQKRHKPLFFMWVGFFFGILGEDVVEFACYEWLSHK